MFRHALKQVKDLKYDSDVITNLLDAQALLFQWRRQHELVYENVSLRNQMQLMQTNDVYKEYEINKLMYYHGMGVKDKIMTQREEYFNFLQSQGLAAPVSVAINQINNIMSPGR